MRAPLAWADVVSTDLDPSLAFYRAVFGWASRPAVGDHPGYRLLLSGAEIVAGAEEVPASKGPARWTVFVETADADALAAGAERAGGAVSFAPTPLGDLGIIAMITDPLGATLGVWQPVAFAPRRVARVEGRIAGAALVTSDVGATRDFLAELAGWRVRRESADGIVMDAGRLPARIVAGPQAQWMPMLHVASVPETLSAIARAGGSTRTTPRSDLPLGADPDGAEFLLTEAFGLPHPDRDTVHREEGPR